ncbi:hypothetical protein [Cellulomonas sp. ATA003]|uniref:hypothetical protein n=1 Tax=Cellulomonas sp. ATA003 TaxID=3073064 RepID=UPI0028732FFC|nr:hypothetical protein [Cellulomonas sp. ATA003]WNB86557.1 hypothetical protein REH70_04810 [Cellulomonas sp. ATA003]
MGMTADRHTGSSDNAPPQPAPPHAAPPRGHVRLVYHYRDGHDFTTEAMLREEAVAYMPLLAAVPVDAEHYVTSFADIELRSA